jgi:tetratricopeptide (TPR) repeat protein
MMARMFRSSEAAARARIADLERQLSEQREVADDQREAAEERVKALQAELEQLKAGQRQGGGWCGWAALGALALVVTGTIVFVKQSDRDPATRCADGEADACVEQADLLKATDRLGAEKLYARACELGSVYACAEDGWLKLSRGDWAAAEPVLRKACEANNARACVNFGVLLSKRDDPNAEAIAGKACDLGDALGCSNLAGLRDDKGDLKQAIELAKKSCNQGSPFGCADLGWYLLKDKKVAEAVKQANRAQQINPNLPKVQINLGYVLLVDGDVEEAVSRFKKGIAMEGGRPTDERTFTDKPWATLVRENLEYLKGVYPDRAADIDTVLKRRKDWNP